MNIWPFNVQKQSPVDEKCGTFMTVLHILIECVFLDKARVKTGHSNLPFNIKKFVHFSEQSLLILSLNIFKFIKIYHESM